MQNESNFEVSGSDSDPVGTRRIDVLDCQPGREASGQKQEVVVLTLGHEDGDVEICSVDAFDARRLLYSLAVALKLEDGPRNPAHDQQVTKRWCVPHTVFRAKLHVEQAEEEYLVGLEKAMPEIATFIRDELKALRRVASKGGRGTTRSDAVVKRMMRALLVAVDAARADT